MIVYNYKCSNLNHVNLVNSWSIAPKWSLVKSKIPHLNTKNKNKKIIYKNLDYSRSWQLDIIGAFQCVYYCIHNNTLTKSQDHTAAYIYFLLLQSALQKRCKSKLEKDGS